MSMLSDLKLVQQARNNIKSAIETVGGGTLTNDITTYAEAIKNIDTGSGFETIEVNANGFRYFTVEIPSWCTDPDESPYQILATSMVFNDVEVGQQLIANVSCTSTPTISAPGIYKIEATDKTGSGYFYFAILCAETYLSDITYCKTYIIKVK